MLLLWWDNMVCVCFREVEVSVLYRNRQWTQKGAHLIFFYKKMETPVILIFISFSFPNLILVNMVPSLYHPALSSCIVLILLQFRASEREVPLSRASAFHAPMWTLFTLYNWYQYLWKCTNHWLLTLFTPKLVSIVISSPNLLQ